MSVLPETSTVVEIDPEKMSGTPVFMGTRVPIRALWDYLTESDGIREFLGDFPTVSKEQASAALEEAFQRIVAHAHCS